MTNHKIKLPYPVRGGEMNIGYHLLKAEAGDVTQEELDEIGAEAVRRLKTGLTPEAIQASRARAHAKLAKSLREVRRTLKAATAVKPQVALQAPEGRTDDTASVPAPVASPQAGPELEGQ